MSSNPWDLFDDDEPPAVGASGAAGGSSASSSGGSGADGTAGPAAAPRLAVVSIPYTRSYAFVAKFLDEHLEPTIADIRGLSRKACAELSDMTNGVLISLEALDKIDSDVRKLWLDERKKATAKSKPGDKSDAPPSREGELDANLSALLGIATRISDETMGYLQSHGQWPHVAYRESYVFAQLIRAVVHAHYGRMQEAMTCMDMALILGAPVEESEDLTKTIELGVLAHNAATNAIMKKQQQVEQQRREKEGLPPAPAAAEDAAPVPSVPVFLGPDASFRTSETLLRSAQAIVAGKSRDDADFIDTLIERVACPGSGGSGGGGKNKKGKGKASSSSSAADGASTDGLEHPLISAVRSVRNPSTAKPVSPADFRRLYLNTRTPVVLNGALKDWQALTKWRDMGHWLKHYGHRTVPIEIGQHLSGFWQEKPMLMSEFVRGFVAPSINEWGWGKWIGLEGVDDDEARALQAASSAASAAEGSPSSVVVTSGTSAAVSVVNPAKVAYLAQHNLFEQIPTLIEDFSVPDYCPGSADLVVNSWWGTAGTVTRLHYDSYNNLFCNAFGYKYVRLYAPSETPKLYPLRKEEAGPARRETVAPSAADDKDGKGDGKEAGPGAGAGKADGKSGKGGKAARKTDSKPAADASGAAERDAATTGQGNVSAFNVDKPDYDAHPLAREAVFTETIVGPGDLLFIPAGYWHFVRSMTPCFSVNFWWSPSGKY